MGWFIFILVIIFLFTLILSSEVLTDHLLEAYKCFSACSLNVLAIKAHHLVTQINIQTGNLKYEARSESLQSPSNYSLSKFFKIVVTLPENSRLKQFKYICREADSSHAKKVALKDFSYLMNCEESKIGIEITPLMRTNSPVNQFIYSTKAEALAMSSIHFFTLFFGLLNVYTFRNILPYCC